MDVENELLRIPKQESSKNRENWEVALRTKTAQLLDRWLEERQQYEKYRDSDAIWLTRERNRYNKQSLRYIVQQLCKGADIEMRGRMISGYTVRHSTGTYLTNQAGDLKTTATQLRQQSIESATKYLHTPVEKRREHLDWMG